MSEALIFVSIALVCLTAVMVAFLRTRNVFMMSRGDVTITFKSTMPLEKIVKEVYMPLVDFSEENVRKWEEHIQRVYSQYAEPEAPADHECGECEGTCHHPKPEPSGSMFL